MSLLMKWMLINKAKFSYSNNNKIICVNNLYEDLYVVI